MFAPDCRCSMMVEDGDLIDIDDEIDVTLLHYSFMPDGIRNHLCHNGFLLLHIYKYGPKWEMLFKGNKAVAFPGQPMGSNNAEVFNAVRVIHTPEYDFYSHVLKKIFTERDSRMKRELFGEREVQVVTTVYMEIAPLCHLRPKFLDPLEPDGKNLPGVRLLWFNTQCKVLVNDYCCVPFEGRKYGTVTEGNMKTSLSNAYRWVNPLQDVGGVTATSGEMVLSKTCRYQVIIVEPNDVLVLPSPACFTFTAQHGCIRFGTMLLRTRQAPILRSFKACGFRVVYEPGRLATMGVQWMNSLGTVEGWDTLFHWVLDAMKVHGKITGKEDLEWHSPNMKTAAIDPYSYLRDAEEGEEQREVCICKIRKRSK